MKPFTTRLILIALLAIIALGLTMIATKKEQETALTTTQSPVDTAQTTATTGQEKTGKITVSPGTLTFSIPSGWGPLSKPVKGQYLLEAANSPFKGNLIGAYQPIYYGETEPETPIEARVFDGFPFHTFLADDTTRWAPSVSLLHYPAAFRDDPPEGYQAMKKEDKQKTVYALVAIYNQSSIANAQIEQKNLAQSEGTTPERHLSGAWWGNGGAITDKIAPRYLENKDKTLRGAGFFINEGQDFTFTPQYRVVLINPDKQLVAQLSFSVTGMEEVQDYMFKPNEQLSGEQVVAKVKTGYQYLESTHAASTDLGKLLVEIQNLVSSMTVQ